MKKMSMITKTISVITLAVFLAAGNPVIAQTSDNTSTSASSNNDRNDDSGKWGLLGLAGLLGLLGLRRRDDDRHRNTTVNR